MTHYRLDLERHGAPGHWRAVHLVLLRPLAAFRAVPHAVVYVDEAGLTRVDAGGPLVPGPLALASPSPHGTPPSDPLRLEGDDVLELNGAAFLVDVYDDHVALRHLPATP